MHQQPGYPDLNSYINYVDEDLEMIITTAVVNFEMSFHGVDHFPEA